MALEIHVVSTKEEDANKDECKDPASIPEKSISHKNSTAKESFGGWKSANFILVHQGMATLAFYGVQVNLVLFLIRVLHYDNATAADNVSKWTGTVYLMSVIGAFLSDSYMGRYLTCLVFQLIFLVGLVLLSLSSWLFLIKPKCCGNGKLKCMHTSSLSNGIFYLSIYMVAVGYGGYQPSLTTLGADQFNEADPRQAQSKTVFFFYFYVALNIGTLISNTVLVYFEDRGQWVAGFWASAAAIALGFLVFSIGTPGYRYLKPCGNPITRIAHVLVASLRKWTVTVPYDSAMLFEMEGPESAIKGSRKILHSQTLRFLDKAATLAEKEIRGLANFSPWRLCTVTQVEEVKCAIKMLPIWLCTIIYSVIFTQMGSLFVQQGAVMKCMIGKFHIPAASISVFDIISVLIFTFIYQKVMIPVTGKFTGNPKGLSALQRMGVGLVFGMLSMVVAGITEIERLRHVIPGHKASSLSVFWQVPQYVLVGASEVFMYVGQLDFFNSQSPDGLKTLGCSLFMASMSLGNYVNSIIVNIVTDITTRGNRPGWIPHDLNLGHIDRFYFLILALAGVDFVAYLFCAKKYKCINLKSNEVEETEDRVDDILLRV